MINKNTQTRELAYVVYIDAIEPIEGKDRVECAIVGGWRVMVRKGLYLVGDPAVYIEIDSLCPSSDERFAFLEKYKYRIKTQKFKGFYSQGLLMSAEELGWNIVGVGQGGNSEVVNGILDNNNVKHFPNTDSAFVTKELGITYYEPEDQKRKAPSVDKYKRMAQRYPKIFQKSFIKWLYKKNWGKKILFVFFGKKKDGRNWPAWVKKTDEERIENMPWILNDKETKWYATEKIDGTSTTFTLKRNNKIFGKDDFYVCSRNVVFDTPEKAENCYYNTNVYIEMAEKYNLRYVLGKILALDSSLDFITIQGETYGEGIQKRDYGLKGHDLAVFNVIFGYKIGGPVRLNPKAMKLLMDEYNIPTVPILNESYILPDTVEELRNYVNSETSKIDNKIKEGIVFRSPDGEKSFKCVSPEFLIKYHN